MKRIASLILLAGAAGCAARYETVTFPPRVDLSKHETIGIVEFSSPDQKDLASMVTARFMESARAEQGLVRMITLRGEPKRPDATRLRQLAEEHGVRTIVIGDLRVSKIRPAVAVSESLSSASVSGSVEATLAVEMIEPATGASLWSASGRTREEIGGVSLQGKSIGFGGVGKDSAYAGMVDALVSQVTRDMHGTWERRRVE